MHKLSELENSVSKLNEKEYAEFRDWFLKQESERWDEEIANDISENKLSSLANEALKDYHKGNFKEL